MTKKIKDQNGNTYVEKKPFYKRIWFWLVIVILLLIGFGSASTSNNSKESTTTNSSQTSSKKAKVPVTYTSALHKAQSYSDDMHMSKQGIYDQLTSEYGEKFKPKAAQYAIDHGQPPRPKGRGL